MTPLRVVLPGLAAILISACGHNPLGPSGTAPQNATRSVPLGISAHQDVPAWAPFRMVRRDAEDLSWVPGVMAQGRTPIILVSYGEKNTVPQRVAEAYGRYPDAWIEVWNEPNLSEMWGDAPDPQAYVAMVAACRAAAPRAKLLGPSVGGPTVDWSYLEASARAGLGQYVDAISIHPYGVGHPSALLPVVSRLRSMYGRPVVISEWGFVADARQPDLVTAAISAASSAGVEFLILYSWADTPEESQGLTARDGSPRPALQMLMGRS